MDRQNFPCLPWQTLGVSGGTFHKEAEIELYDDFIPFLLRWALHTMATFELPIPMRAEFAQPSLYPLDQVSCSGVLAFLPWWAFRTKEISLRELYEYSRKVSIPAHLGLWLNGTNEALGPKRCRNLLKLYIYFELVLRRRYRDKIRRKLAKLDLAFGMFIYGEPEKVTKKQQSIEKLRKDMTSQLKMCRPEIKNS